MKGRKKSNHTAEGVRISIISILFSLVLTLFKLVSGIVGKSAALVSDGVNSLGDIFSYSVVATGVAASDKKADSNHQYGHDKLESIISLFLALVIAVTGFAIGFKAVRSLVVETYIAIPTLFPLIVAALSIVIKLILWQLARVAAAKTDLSSLKALASDHFSDMLSSTGALIAVVGARLGYPLLDPVASLVIALLIIKSAFEVFLISYNVLMDSSVDKQTKNELKKAILADKRVQGIDLLRTRSVGSGYWVELEITCCRNLKLFEAHAIAEEVHDRLEKEFPKIRHVMVHTNPCSSDGSNCTECAANSENNRDESQF